MSTHKLFICNPWAHVFFRVFLWEIFFGGFIASRCNLMHYMFHLRILVFGLNFVACTKQGNYEMDTVIIFKYSAFQVSLYLKIYTILHCRSAKQEFCMTLVYWLKVLVVISLHLIAC